jgi:hypothetical protein
VPSSPQPCTGSAAPAATDHRHRQAPNRNRCGLRVTFGAAADLSQASATAIKNIIQSAPPGDATFNVVAHAAGTPKILTARRLRRAPGGAERLMADGVTSSRIHLRALWRVGATKRLIVDLSVRRQRAGRVARQRERADAGAKSQTWAPARRST